MRNLTGQAFLQLQPARISVDEPRQLRNADHACPRPIGDVRYSGDRREVMLAGRYHGNRTQRARVFVAGRFGEGAREQRSEEHTSELQSLMRISYAVFCLKKKRPKNKLTTN